MTRLLVGLFVAVLVPATGRALGAEDGGVVQPEVADFRNHVTELSKDDTHLYSAIH